MPSRRAFSAYQRCGIELRPWTASTSACTDSSLASFARLRLAIQLSKCRSRSSTDLSARSVFNTNDRVRRPGSSPLVTASAAARRTSRSGACSCPSAASSVVVSPSSSIADARHLLFEEPLERAAAGDRLLGEDDLFGLGEQVRPVAALRRRWWRANASRIVGEQRLDLVVGQLGPLELEEEELGVDRRAPFLDAAACARRGRGRSCRSRSRDPRSCRRGRRARARRRARS